MMIQDLPEVQVVLTYAVLNGNWSLQCEGDPAQWEALARLVANRIPPFALQGDVCLTWMWHGTELLCDLRHGLHREVWSIQADPYLIEGHAPDTTMLRQACASLVGAIRNVRHRPSKEDTP